MAKFYFKYGTVQSGKSSVLIGIAKNYQKQGKDILILSPKIDTRGKAKDGFVVSRTGESLKSVKFDTTDKLMKIVLNYMKNDLHDTRLYCVLVDEAQFLTAYQVNELSHVVDDLNVPVIAFGLRQDFKGDFFEGSKYLLGIVDSIEEIKTVCWFCDKKATMNMKIDKNGNAEFFGNQISIGDSFLPVCRKCYRDRFLKSDVSIASCG